MNTWPRLSNAPIVEGLIDIRVERSTGVSVERLQVAGDELAAEFPSRQELRNWMGQINLSDAVPSIAQAVNEPGGFILRSADEKWVAQFRLDGFTLSRLAPYGSWDELKGKAHELWAKYSAAATPARVLRVASRFINRIQMPLGESFETIFSTNFVIAPKLPQAVSGYLLRLVIPFDEQEAVAILTQSLDANSNECIFDLDAFSWKPAGISEAEMWNKLDDLRDVKNRLFFGSLTDAAVERFK